MGTGALIALGVVAFGGTLGAIIALARNNGALKREVKSAKADTDLLRAIREAEHAPLPTDLDDVRAFLRES